MISDNLLRWTIHFYKREIILDTQLTNIIYIYYIVQGLAVCVGTM